jgi:hypothetical protein
MRQSRDVIGRMRGPWCRYTSVVRAPQLVQTREALHLHLQY